MSKENIVHEGYGNNCEHQFEIAARKKLFDRSASDAQNVIEFWICEQCDQIKRVIANENEHPDCSFIDIDENKKIRETKQNYKIT